MTYEQLIDKVKARLEKEPNRLPGDPNDPHEALCWFIAIQDAKEVLDSFRLKDFASIIQKGEPLGGPYETQTHVEAWAATIDEIHGDSEREKQEAWQWLDEALDHHFGVR